MKTIILLLTLLSLNAFANENYKCYNVQGVRGSPEMTLTLTTALFSKKITAVELVKKIKGTFEVAESPFDEVSAANFEIDQETIKAASELKYQSIQKHPTSVDKSSYKIVLSESILNLEETGYAYYYGNQCWWLLDCRQASLYFKCDRL